MRLRFLSIAPVTTSVNKAVAAVAKRTDSQRLLSWVASKPQNNSAAWVLRSFLSDVQRHKPKAWLDLVLSPKAVSEASDGNIKMIQEIINNLKDTGFTAIARRFEGRLFPAGLKKVSAGVSVFDKIA